MTSELKPCPFCGGDARFENEHPMYENRMFIGCGECNAEAEPLDSIKRTKDDQVALWNTRSEPDVPELARYSAIELVRSIDAGYDPLPSDDGDYVEFSQAAAIIAEKDSEIALKDTGLKIAMTKIAALEAKLAQYEAQEPVGYIYTTPSYDAGGGTRFTPRKPTNGNEEWYGNLRAVYVSPAPAADLKAENERLRFRLNAAADDFDLIQQRINDGQIERAKATAWQGEREARAALNVEASNE